MFPTFITLKALAILMLLDEAMIPKERFFLLPPELINYLLANMRRSFAYARKLVAEIDNISLSRKRAVTTANENIQNK